MKQVAIIGIIFVSILNFSVQNVVKEHKRQVPACECGVARTARRIVGGTETLVNKYPWEVAIIRRARAGSSQFCGGSLITANHVLSAAHCMIDSQFPLNEIVMSLGDHDLSSTKETNNTVKRVVQVTIHPQYNDKTKDNDIAIFKLESPVVFSEYIRPICMPPTTFDPTNKTVTVAGWGLTTSKGPGSYKLREVQVIVVNRKQCNASYQGFITNNMICAGVPQGGKDSCQGDSGGPLFYQCGTKNMQVGIVSFGNGCGEPGYPGIYTNVMAYSAFIQSVIGTDKICTIPCTS